MKKITAFILFSMFIAQISFSQNKEEGFKPSGKAFVLVFSNFNTTFEGGKTTPAFALDRAYFGYVFDFSKNFSGKINFDVGDPKDGGGFQMTAFVKNAYLKYTLDKFSVLFGIIPTTLFDVQEKIWGYRYIEKSFQDANNFASSADLGISASYALTGWLSADLIVMNGEGFKKIQADSDLRSGIGLTLKPLKKLTARVYYDIMGKDSAQTTFSSYLSYDFGKVSINAEYNLQNNFDNGNGKDWSGVSFYATAIPFKNIKLFGRYDYLTSVTVNGQTNNWNLSKDGSLIMAGIEFQPVTGVKLSPNYRLNNPADPLKSNINSFFLNCEIKF